ncbi:MAG TPA: SLC13 family permease [Burkholderiales bacterium]|nr:SLC13 family permease [Burkholderiales bacterium]
MAGSTIVFAVIIAALALFIWNKIPAVIVAIGVSLALFFSGILTGGEVLAGLGDPTVILIAGLFVVGAGLEASGVTTWAGQVLVAKSGGNKTRAFLLLCLLAALATATISVNGTVAALLPMVIVVALRLGEPTSQLLVPLCFAAHSATMLTLLGAPLNVIARNMAEEAGYGIGFFEFAVAGVPIFIGSVTIMLLTKNFLLPKRNGASLPADFSAHAQTLVEQYRIEDGLHALRVRASSPYVGKPRAAVDLKKYPGLSLVAIQEGEGGKPLSRTAIAEGDMILIRGEREPLGRLATEQHLALRSGDELGSVAQTLFNKGSGLAEVVIPTRSKLVGQTVFPGMSARDGDLMVLAVQRGGEDLGAAPTALQVGDHLLLQGTWQALDKHLADPQVIVVDSPEVVRRQAIPLGHRAWEAIAVLVALVVMLVGNWFPAALVAVICSVALVLLRVLTVPQAYKGIDWNTCILVGGMIPLATAMRKTGAAELLADQLILLVGALGPRAILAGLFLVTFALTSVMSNTAAALVMLPIAVATGVEMGVSPMAFIIAVTVGAHGALLTPVATPVNLMVVGPGGYQFGDYWKYGLPIGIWWLVVVAFLVPLYWKF